MRRSPLTCVCVAFAVFLGSASARAAEPSPEPIPETAETLDANALEQAPLISMGTPTQMCQFPTAVLMFGFQGSCTGTLIHPQIVSYAAHCPTVNEVRFGESFNSVWRTVPVDFCMRNPEWDENLNNGVNGSDYAFCKLAEPVNDIPITPPVYGCELDMLRPNEPALIVGFGDNTDGSGAGTKRWAETIIQTPVFPDSDQVAVGEVGTAACSGDSGGPAYYRYPDGSWHTFGIVSGGPPCGSGADTYSLVHRAVPFIEANSGVDVTPCHDVDGTWNPGPDCGGFATNISAPNASPNNGCSTEVSGLLETCGPAFGAPPDTTPPFVSITSPANNAEIEANVAIDILVDAQDPDFGVEAVGLMIDGDLVSTDNYEPWEFADAVFPAGTYTLVAVAEDYSGNVAESNPVTLIVGGGGGGSGDGDGDGDPATTGTSGDGDPTDTGLTSGETTDGFPGIDPVGEEGCACATRDDDGGAPASTGLALLALIALRRRRRSA